MELEPIIGLEIHIQLKTKSKMFCSCSNMGNGDAPNTLICPVCLGHPGTLPVLNSGALKLGLKMALALSCQISDTSKFDRKNYFYPDLPKGYQISQYDKPIAERGEFEIKIPAIKGQVRPEAKIRITRTHLEEDAAKLLHDPEKKYSLVDYNRAGAPLLEIVTEPDFKTPLEAKIFLQELRLLARHLEISDANMEKGQLRCDANISMREFKKNRKSGFDFSDTSAKIEVKNMNSFKSVEKALEYEIKRQSKLWKEKKPPQIPATYGWNDEKGITELQRTKEQSPDYRYFPEPDIPPLDLRELKQEMKNILPELPQEKRKRFIDQYGFNAGDAVIISADKNLANYTEQIVSELKSWLKNLPEIESSEEEIWQNNKKKLAKLISGWLINRYAKLLEEKNITAEESKITPENFAELLTLLYQNKINSNTGQKILEQMFDTGIDPSHAIEEQGLEQVSDENQIEKIIDKVIEKNPKQAEEYRGGKEPVIKYLIGMAMKESKGKANPQIVEKIIKEKLK